ncbi:MAG: flagellar hook-length control protein FliK, partial [Alphaproteobacteria bacterium]
KKIEIKNEKENITNLQSKNISNNLIEKKQKKKGKQLFQNTSAGNSELSKSNAEKKIAVSPNDSLNIKTKKQIENFSSRKIIETKDKVKGPKQIVSNSNENKILNFMENNWEQKFSTIIKESLRNNINKIELDVKPKNLGKVRLEVKVDKDVTNIDFTTESIETANLLNENINKISDFLNEGKENYLSQNKNSNQNFNHQKNKRDSSNQKNLVDNKKDKSSIDMINNSNHNIDVNA